MLQQFWVKREKVELDYGITTTTDNQPEQFDDPRIQVELAHTELILSMTLMYCVFATTTSACTGAYSSNKYHHCGCHCYCALMVMYTVQTYDMIYKQAKRAWKRQLLEEASSPLWEEAELFSYDIFDDYTMSLIQFGEYYSV
jgi:hypothetical protein